jgi:hypothetical protein
MCGRKGVHYQHRVNQEGVKMIAIVCKMGDQRYVNVTDTKFRLGQVVSLKPKGVSVIVMRKVAKMGDRRIVTIPKNYFDYFKHGSEVYVKKW